MALESYCASCTYLGDSSDYEGKYYCEEKGRSCYACDSKCYNWVEAYGRSNYSRENMYQNSLSHLGNGGCYLTTAMCNILNYPDDNYYLQMLRTFRDETLKKDYKYLPILLTYDIIGPQIAKSLENDPNKKTIAKTLFTGYITKAVTAIEEQKTQEAVNIYVAMTHSLARRYNINTHTLYIDPKSINLDTIDINTLGHGKSRIRKKLENI